MARARTFLKCEITDAAAAAAENGLRVTFHPSGAIEMAPALAPRAVNDLDNSALSPADRALAEWQANESKSGGHPYRS